MRNATTPHDGLDRATHGGNDIAILRQLAELKQKLADFAADVTMPASARFLSKRGVAELLSISTRSVDRLVALG